MHERKLSIGDRVRVSMTYGHNPYIRGVIGTIIGPPSHMQGWTPKACHYVEFDEPVTYPDQDTACRGCAVPIAELELLAPSSGSDPS